LQTPQEKKNKTLQRKPRETSLKSKLTTKLFVDLGLVYNDEYNTTHEGSALANTIKYYKMGLEHHPIDRIYHGLLLSNLGDALMTRYEQLGDMKDLEQTIVCHQQALDRCLPAHPLHSSSLHNLGHAFIFNFRCSGNLSDLTSATKLFKDALSLLPAYHPFCYKLLIAQASLQLTVHQSAWVKCTDCSHIHDACVFFESATNHLTSGLLHRFEASKEWVQAAHKHNHKSILLLTLRH
jgi:hypothetical protein